MNTFKINEYTYAEDSNGIIRQINPEPFTYNENYISCYDSPNYKENDLRLQVIRYNLIADHIPDHSEKSLLDYGYGRGSFLKYVTGQFKELYGYDINGTELPEGVKPISRIAPDIITMFDVLEHLQLNPYPFPFKPEYFVISVPNRPNLGQMATWKHLKPNEHINHFNKESLRALMKSWGYEVVVDGYFEDVIRVGAPNNILTGIFKCK
jgi:23S rRNA U2552 (ribose-2'-O)-methylase RlmE/FtsJ